MGCELERLKPLGNDSSAEHYDRDNEVCALKAAEHGPDHIGDDRARKLGETERRRDDKDLRQEHGTGEHRKKKPGRESCAADLRNQRINYQPDRAMPKQVISGEVRGQNDRFQSVPVLVQIDCRHERIEAVRDPGRKDESGNTVSGDLINQRPPETAADNDPERCAQDGAG